MTSTKTRALAIFIVSALILAVFFFTVPINLFDGKIHYIEPQREYTLDAPLSLSYFIGLGYEETEMQYVDSFWLTIKGWIMACLFIFGFPALLAYRIYLREKKS